MKKMMAIIMSMCIFFSVAAVGGLAEDEVLTGENWSYNFTSGVLEIFGTGALNGFDTGKIIYFTKDVNGLIMRDDEKIALYKGKMENGCKKIIISGYTEVGNTTDGIKFSNLKRVEEVCFSSELEKISDSALSTIRNIGETLQKITVDSQNKYFKSIDGILYTKDMELLLYPYGKTDEVFNVPSGIRQRVSQFGEELWIEISNPHLKKVIVPEDTGECNISVAYPCMADLYIYSKKVGGGDSNHIHMYKESKAYSDVCKNASLGYYQSVELFDGKLDSFGSYGENISWKYDEMAKNLIISGSGEMAEPKYDGHPYFGLHFFKTDNIVFENGITYIASDIFSGYSFKNIIIPKSVKSISEWAFHESNADNIYYEGTQAEWDSLDKGTIEEDLPQTAIHFNYIADTGKTQQNIIVNEIEEKTYGDDSFKLDVIPDSESKLSNFTYESNNSNVADISDDGTVTIKSAGEADITVREAGNDDYAPFRKTVKLTVNRKSVSITSVDVGAKTAELSGVLGADTDKVEIDFDKITVELVGDNDENTMKILIKNLELAGDKSKNYSLTQESIESIVSNENVVSIEAEGENGSVTGAAKYIKGSAVTVKAEPENGYSFKGWYIGESEVSTEAEYKFTAENNVKLTAKFEKIPSRRSGSRSTPSYSIRFNANGGSEIGNISVKQGQAIGSVSEPKKDGYKFNGWYYDEELTKPYGSGDKITASSTLYAAWIADPSRAIVLTIGENESVVFGKTVTNDVAPKIVNGRTMLPARFVAEHLGAEVAWDEDERAVKITGKNGDGEAVEIVITIGAKTAIVNGEEIELDSAAFIENDRTYTPVRFITEQLGAKVDWNEETHRVTLIK